MVREPLFAAMHPSLKPLRRASTEIGSRPPWDTVMKIPRLRLRSVKSTMSRTSPLHQITDHRSIVRHLKPHHIHFWLIRPFPWPHILRELWQTWTVSWDIPPSDKLRPNAATVSGLRSVIASQSPFSDVPQSPQFPMAWSITSRVAMDPTTMVPSPNWLVVSDTVSEETTELPVNPMVGHPPPD